MSNYVRLISLTKGAESLNSDELIAYTARVSNPNNQANHETAPKLLAYLIKHKHWSPFEMADMTIEISTSRAIAAQILRHRSFSFQEFSQRYAEASDYIEANPRRQDLKNKQNSLDDLDDDTKIWFRNMQEALWEQSSTVYAQALKKGIAKESARMLLPLSTVTKLYMKGSVRSWIHYIETRTDVSTQLEHREIAEECKKIFIENFPGVASALNWR